MSSKFFKWKKKQKTKQVQLKNDIFNQNKITPDNKMLHYNSKLQEKTRNLCRKYLVLSHKKTNSAK